MIGSAVTVSLVEESRGGPFVFWNGLEDACERAASFGFDAIEIFPRDAEQLDVARIRTLLTQNGLRLAAVGTGAGWVCQRLTLSNHDPLVRQSAVAFCRSIIEKAGELAAPAIIGSMQGRASHRDDHEAARQRLADSMRELAQYAETFDVPVLYEPLNRYETDLIHRLVDGTSWIEKHQLHNTKLLADLFHMNIEESNVADALSTYLPSIGHIHYADSNRCAMGMGHTQVAPLASVLQAGDYDGYLSAEILSFPDSDSAARSTIESFQNWFGKD